MIETTNPEIDVNQLMARVRAEAARISARPAQARRSRSVAPSEPVPELPQVRPLPPAPAVWIPGAVTPRKEKLDELVQTARQKTEVSSMIPKFLRGLFRKQGAYNKGVLDGIKVLAQSNHDLTKRVREIGTCLEQLNGWLLALHQHREADVQWMTAVAPVFTILARHGEEVRKLEIELETDLEAQLTEIAEQQEASARRWQGEIETRDEVLTQRINAIEKEDERLAQRINAIEREDETLAGRIDAIEADDQTLRGQIEQLGVQINNVHAEANTVAEQAGDLQQQLHHAGEHLRNLQGQMDTIGLHLNNLQGEWDRRTEQAQIDKVALHLRNLQAQADRLGVHVNNLQVFVDQHTAETRTMTHNLERRIDDQAGLNAKVGWLEERQMNEGVFLKGELSEQGALLRRLLGPQADAGTKAKALPSDARQKKSLRALDSFYLSFENRFRGSRSEIKKRVKFYLPFLARADAGKAGRPVLDLGCGRGEWLELLRENKLEGHGVDLNSAMVAQCRERELKVTHGDALDHLRSLRPNSQGGVTGFHIIEHLPFETLMEFLREARRVLKPGGIAIFESPNCKNLVVGASNFNIDPTHRNPVFPETAEFMLQSHGFERISIEYLSPVPGVKFDDSTRELATLKDMLYGPQDFAVIAHKPAAK